mgnify:FL=1
MDFKIELVCNKCKCAFELRPTDFRERTSMECPNCGQTFPSGIYSKLKSGIVLLGEVPKTITENDANPFAETLFTAQVKSYGDHYELLNQP